MSAGTWLSGVAGPVVLMVLLLPGNSSGRSPGSNSGDRWEGSASSGNTPPDVPLVVGPADGSEIAALSTNLTVRVGDADGDSLAVTFHGRKAPLVRRAPFSIVVIPDTQYYSRDYPATFTAQTQWIVNQRDPLNVAYVAHVGDIVENAPQAQQWQNADNALRLFDAVPELPLGLCVGNHDQDPVGNPAGTAAFNTWFPYTRYESRSWYGGHFGSTNDNHYILFSASGMDFIAIHITYDPSGPTAVLPWAAALLDAYPDRRGMVVAHSLLNVSGDWSFQGSRVYDALKSCSNFFLMLCGHSPGEAQRDEVYEGRTVYALLSDYQDRANGGDGWLRVLEFVPDDDAIRVSTYSPTLDEYERDADSAFALAYDMGGVPFTELATLSGISSGTDASVTWTRLEPGRSFEWYATVEDGQDAAPGPVATFSSIHPPTPEITVSPTGLERFGWVRRNLLPDVLNISNAGIGSLSYTVASDAPWIQVAPQFGESDGSVEQIEVSYNTVGLPVGLHDANITLDDPQAWNSPLVIPVTVHVQTVRPDFDLDGDVDMEDFGRFQICLGAPGQTPSDPSCLPARLDGDEDVDQADFGIFQRCLSGANRFPEIDCTGT